ncbi:unnamed protein product, partial [Heterosigma akashiwo]
MVVLLISITFANGFWSVISYQQVIARFSGRCTIVALMNALFSTMMNNFHCALEYSWL